LTFCPHKKEQNRYHQTRFCASKYTKNARTPLHGVAYSASPDPLAGFGEGGGREREGGGMGGEEEKSGKERKGRGKEREG